MIQDIVPNFCREIPYLEDINNYFTYGIYDVLNMIAIMLGALSAFLVLTITRKGEYHENHKIN